MDDEPDTPVAPEAHGDASEGAAALAASEPIETPPVGPSEPIEPSEALASDDQAAAGEPPAVRPSAAEADPDPPYELSAQDLRAILEALIFASPEPITPRQIGQVLSDVPKETWQQELEGLREEYARAGRGLQLVDVAGGFQITTRPECNDRVRELLDPKGASRLSIQALETLAVIAYKQPVTLPEVIELRGVKSGGVIKTLLEKRLIKIVGRKEVVGRPMLYGSTREFLLQFGLKDLTELPRIEEFADVLGEDVDVVGLKRAIEAPRPVEVPLSEEEPLPVEPDQPDAPSERAPEVVDQANPDERQPAPEAAPGSGEPGA